MAGMKYVRVESSGYGDVRGGCVGGGDVVKVKLVRVKIGIIVEEVHEIGGST